jgi:hypothetical protein
MHTEVLTVFKGKGIRTMWLKSSERLGFLGKLDPKYVMYWSVIIQRPRPRIQTVHGQTS